MTGKRSKQVRLADVAADVGVSVQLVSAVMNGSGPTTIGASQATRERIQEAAERLGYRRNAGAASLRTKQHGRIGVLLDRQDAGVFLPQNMLAAITERLGHASLGLMLDNVLLSSAESRRNSRLMNEDCVDALIVALAQDPAPALVRLLRGLKLPLVWLHRPLARNAVYYDEAGAAAGLVDHLARRGYRSIDYLDLSAPGKEVFAANQRSKGFQRACRKHGVRGTIVFEHRVPRPERAAFARQWLTDHPDPTAMIVGSCSAAQVFLDVALSMQRSVPDSLALATFDSGSLCTANAPELTAAIFSEWDFGTAVGEMAVALAGPMASSKSRVVECPVQAGGST